LDQIYDEIYEINEKYGDVFNLAMTRVSEVFRGIMNDPVMQKFTNDWEKLVRDIFMDENGKVSYSAAIQSFQQLNKALIPLIRSRLDGIQLPNIEVESSKYDYTISNVMLSLNDLLPEEVHFESRTTLDIVPGESNIGETSVKLRFHPLELHIETMEFYYKRKSMFKYSDYGTLSMTTEGGHVELEFNFRINNNMFLLEFLNADVVMDNFSFEIINAKHKTLDKVFYTVLKPTIKAKLENTLASTYEKIGKKICEEINNAVTSATNKNHSLYKKVQETNETSIDPPKELHIGIGDKKKPKHEKTLIE